MIEGLVPADKAWAIITAGAGPLDVERIALADTAARVLGEDLAALRTQPPFDASAMDGYAVRQADLADLPASLAVIGTSAAGHPFNGPLGPGQAVRIFTGAQVPAGADTIVIQENTTTDVDSVTVLEPATPGRYIRRAGLDFAEGEVLLEKGRLLDAQSVALAASMNHATVPVFRKPAVAIIATGDELVAPGGELAAGQIIASNSYGLGAIARAAGAHVMDLGIVADTRQALGEAARRALDDGADLIVTIGGASVGDHDLVAPAMRELGFEFAFAKIAMRPGKPLLYATHEHSGRTVRLVGLAGNPVSSLVSAQVFVRPLINLLAGRPAHAVEPIGGRLGRDLPANDERAEYMRATAIRSKDGTIIATPFENQDSSMLANLTRADCLVIRPVAAPAAREGEPCELVPLRDL